MQKTETKLENVDLSFGQRVIFKNLSLTIPEGKITAIMGPSGTGKTTLLKLLSSQLSPNKGSVILMGEPLGSISTTRLYELRKQMGVLFQSGALFTDMSVYDNIAFPLREHTRLSESLIEILVLLKLEAVGLRALVNSMPNELSGGQARRVAIARAIALDPKFLLYDEPFTGQDPISMGVLLRLIKGLNTALNLTSVVVSHDVAEVMSIADKVCILNEGSVIAEGTPEEVSANQNEWVQQFLLGNSDGPVPFHLPTIPINEALLK